MRQLSICVIWLLLPIISSCGSNLKYYGKLCGTIVSEDTSQPIPGVVVMARWETDNFTDSRYSLSRPGKIEEVVSDEEGRFCINGQGIAILPREPSIEIFKAGYSNIADTYYPNLKQGQRYKDVLVWDGNHVTVRLKKLSLPERYERWRQVSPYNIYGLDSDDYRKRRPLFEREVKKEDEEVRRYKESLEEPGTSIPMYGIPPSDTPLLKKKDRL